MTLMLMTLLSLSVGVISGIWVGGYFSIGSRFFHQKSVTSGAPDNCKHKQWTKWKVEQLKAIHVYDAIDDGKDLPDRVDSYMTRECLSCGLPQAKTVRGIDSQHFK